MTTSQVVLLVGVAALEVVLLLGVMGLPPGGKERGRAGRVLTLLAAQALGAVLFLAGGYTQTTHGWFTSALARWEDAAIPFEPFQPTGDPSLARQVEGVERASPAPGPGSVAGFARWQVGMRRYLDSAVLGAGIPPEGPPPPHRVLAGTVLPDGVARSFVTVPGFDGTPIPGYLFVPRGAAGRPAVLVLSGHGKGIVETAGLVPSYQHEAALRLARAGYVTFTPELRGFGYLGARIGNEHLTAAHNALLAGRSFKAYLLRDLRQMVSWLRAHPAVDRERIGVTGVSFGGEMSVALASTDPRVKVVVAQGTETGTGRHEGYHADPNPGLPHVLCHFFDVPNRHLALEDPFLLVAPRPLLLVRGTEEGPPDPALSGRMRGVYRMHGVADHFATRSVRGGHEYFADPAIAFFRRHL